MTIEVQFTTEQLENDSEDCIKAQQFVDTVNQLVESGEITVVDSENGLKLHAEEA